MLPMARRSFRGRRPVRRTARKSYRKRFSKRGSFRQGKQSSKYLFNRRWQTQSGIVSSEVGESSGAFVFKLDDLPDYTEFTSLFDQYRICAVKVTITSPYTGNTGLVPRSGAANGLGTMPAIKMYSVSDYDDAVTLTVAQLMQYQNCRITELTTNLKGGKASFFIKPRLATAVYSGAFTSYGNTKMWLDAASPSVEHYGFKWAFDAIYADGGIAGTATTWGVATSLQWDLKYYVAFRNVR